MHLFVHVEQMIH